MSFKVKGKKKADASLDRPVFPLRRSARSQSRTGSRSASQPIVLRDSPQRVQKTRVDGTLATKEVVDGYIIDMLPARLPSQLPGLTNEGAKLLQYKQRRLKSPTSQVHQLHEFCNPNLDVFRALKTAVDATLVFAQEEAGTAVCISPDGLLLTCSHCVAETAEDLDLEKIWWLVFSSGQVVCAKTVKRDSKRDVALLRTISAQNPLTQSTLQTSTPPISTLDFPSINLTPTRPSIHTPLFCIGHPGSEDLEIGRPGVATEYDMLHISEGTFRGYAKGQDVQDNSEIGALMHDCWTYWGHSGAPLVDRRNGGLVGLHSSWDDQTGMRRGVGWEAVGDFLKGVDDNKEANEQSTEE